MGDDDRTPTQQTIHRWVGIVGLFIAPTSVITAMCVYFGYVSTRKSLAYFGVDSNAIGFTTTDHVMGSISVLFAPILVLLILWVAVIWTAEYLRRLLETGRHTRPLRFSGWTAVVMGAVLALRGVVGVLLPQVAVPHNPVVTPLTLGAGTALVVVGCWLVGATRRHTVPHPFAASARASLFVAAAVLLMALFWLTNIFATAWGAYEAENTAAQLWTKETGVVLDTADALNMPDNLVRKSTLGDPAATPQAESSQPVTYRYECFRALVVRGDQWVLVPAKWTPQFGYAVIVTDDSANRISVTRIEGIDKTGAADWDKSMGPDGWQCPEVAPASAYSS